MKVNAMSFGKLVALMVDGVYTCRELSELTGLSYLTVLHYCKAMHHEGGCYIDHWEVNDYGRVNVMVYRLGRGKDAKRVPKSKADVAKAYKARKRHQEMVQATAGGLQ